MNDGTDYRAILLAGTPLIDVRAPRRISAGRHAGRNKPSLNER